MVSLGHLVGSLRLTNVSDLVASGLRHRRSLKPCFGHPTKTKRNSKAEPGPWSLDVTWSRHVPPKPCLTANCLGSRLRTWGRHRQLLQKTRNEFPEAHLGRAAIQFPRVFQMLPSILVADRKPNTLARHLQVAHPDIGCLPNLLPTVAALLASVRARDGFPDEV